LMLASSASATFSRFLTGSLRAADRSVVSSICGTLAPHLSCASVLPREGMGSAKLGHLYMNANNKHEVSARKSVGPGACQGGRRIQGVVSGRSVNLRPHRAMRFDA
jgi:hypothetical protein